MLLSSVVRRCLHLFCVSLRESIAVRLEPFAELRRAAHRPRYSSDQEQRFSQALDSTGNAGLVLRDIVPATRAARDGQRAEGVGRSDGPRCPAIETPHEVRWTLEVHQ